MKKYAILLILIIYLAMYTSCDPWTDPSHEPILMTGIVTDGSVFNNGTVYIKDARGKTVSGKINDTGHYFISVEGMMPPFILLAKNEQGNNPLYSGFHDFGTANINNFTNTVMALAFNDLPEDIFPVEHVIKNDYLLSKLPSAEVFRETVLVINTAYQKIFHSFLKENTDLMYGQLDEQISQINSILNVLSIDIKSEFSGLDHKLRNLICTISFDGKEVLKFKINTNNFEDEKISIINRAAIDFQKSRYYFDICKALGVEIEEEFIITGTVSNGKNLLKGDIYLKDFKGVTLKTTIGEDGKYTLDGENITPPFILLAEYESQSEDDNVQLEYLYSGYYKNKGIVNITPFTNAIIALCILDVPGIGYRINDVIIDGVCINDLPDASDFEMANSILYSIFSEAIGIDNFSFIYSQFEFDQNQINKFLSIIRYELKVIDGDFIINFYFKEEVEKFFKLIIPRNSTNEEKRDIVNNEIQKSITLKEKLLVIKEELLE